MTATAAPEFLAPLIAKAEQALAARNGMVDAALIDEIGHGWEGQAALEHVLAAGGHGISLEWARMLVPAIRSGLPLVATVRYRNDASAFRKIVLVERLTAAGEHSYARLVSWGGFSTPTYFRDGIVDLAVPEVEYGVQA